MDHFAEISKFETRHPTIPGRVASSVSDILSGIGRRMIGIATTIDRWFPTPYSSAYDAWWVESGSAPSIAAFHRKRPKGAIDGFIRRRIFGPHLDKY